jgi:hypothetical protein
VIKRLILLFGLTGMLVSLGSCDWWSKGSSYPRRDTQAGYDRRAYDERIAREEERRARRAAAARDRRDSGDIYDIYDSPAAWLSLDYACSGALRRAQWLVCENDHLGLLHRRLALQWEAARRIASPERVNVLIAQQHAFLSERNACENIVCVTAAYHRYLDSGAASAKPWVKPVHKPYPANYRPKWGHKRGDGYHGRGHGKGTVAAGHHGPSYESRSCISEIGFAAASQLADRCDNVTPGLSSQCSVHNSCGGIRAQTDRGCGTRHNKPGYCRSY